MLLAAVLLSCQGRGERLTRLGCMMIGYFTRETTLLSSDEDGHNVSSDIIESLFGGFKERKSPNRIVDVKLWERENLPGNLAAKRARVLRQAC